MKTPRPLTFTLARVPFTAEDMDVLQFSCERRNVRAVRVLDSMLAADSNEARVMLACRHLTESWKVYGAAAYVADAKRQAFASFGGGTV